MNARLLLLAGAAALAVSCDQGTKVPTDEAAASSNATTASAPKHPTYCFFKDADTKGWSAARGKDGITVTGKARLEDSRYSAQLVQPEVKGTSASLWLTMGPNNGPYGAPDNWWDVKANVPNSDSVTSVAVMCGTKTVAQLTVAAAG